MNKSRYKNPYFWIGIIGVIVAASDVEVHSLTTWGIVFDNIKYIVSNPVHLAGVVMATLGVFVNPTTKGIKD